jgi:beta-glucosidase
MTKIKDLIAQMTLDEKASLCSGQNFWFTKSIQRLGIPSIMLTDGPHGLRKQAFSDDHLGINESIPATCFPTASALAATWNRDLVEQVGVAIGEECCQEKVGVILGPGANIKRSPLCGRNFEYFSEDPYLSGEMAKSHIQGVQSQGIGASLKHYAANNQEYRRMTIDAVVDERALHEIYLAGFEIAVRDAQPWTVMGAYNRLNGTYCCENPFILRDLLKDKWGHSGLAVTDWGAMNERVPALKAGLDLEMPGSTGDNDALIVKAIRSGELDESVLDQAVERILKIIFKAHDTLAEEYTYDPDEHHALARKVAGEGAVLLKNEDQTLPLAKETRVALLGAFAKSPRYQGAGSSLIKPTRLDNLHAEMVKIAGAERIIYAAGYPSKGLVVDENLLNQAIQVAEQADVVVIHIGLPDSFEVEGVDRTHLALPESHNRLVEAVAAIHDNVVVVLSNGAPVEMPWAGDVQAILEGYLGGQAGAGALADILYGVVNPSGKLAETFPLKAEDNPSYANFPGGPKTVEYRESLYVGYRFYETVEKEVLFPFGYGLSYTTFAYENLLLSKPEVTDQETLTVELTVRNTGDVAGKEIVQLYVSPVSPTAFRPKLELKGFAKVDFQPGEVKPVTFSLDQRAIAHFSTAISDWQVESGLYRILVGASAHHILLEGEVRVTSSQPGLHVPERDRLPAYVNFPADANISQADFEALLGRAAPPNFISKGETATINTPLSDMQHSLIARQLRKTIKKQSEAILGDDPDGPMAQMIQATLNDAPLRALILNGGDAFPQEMADGLLLMINRQYFKGLKLLLQSRKKSRQ